MNHSIKSSLADIMNGGNLNDNLSKFVEKSWRQKGLEEALDSIPRVGLPKESTQEERIAKIFGIKVSQLGQLFKRVKTSHPKLFKEVIKKCKSVDLPRDLPKGHFEAKSVCLFLGHHDYRKSLMSESVLLARGGNGFKPCLPIVEYELIKLWNPNIDLNALASAGVDPVDEEFDAPSCFKLTYTSQHTETIRPGYQRHITEIADAVLLDLASWEEKSDHQRSLVAGAAFAIASMTDRPSLLESFVNLVPELGAELDLRSCNTDQKKNDDDSNDARSRRISRKVLLTVNQLEDFRTTLDLDALYKARSDLDFFEKEVLDLGQREVKNIRGIIAEITNDITEISELFSKAGVAIVSAPLESRLKHWTVLLQHPVMETPSPARLKLVNDILAEAQQLRKQVFSVCESLVITAEKREIILKEDHPSWSIQLEKLNLIAAKTQECKDELDALCEELKQREPIPVQHVEVVLDESPKPCLESELSALQRQHALEVEGINQQLVQAMERNDKLRQENADARNQVDLLKLSLGEQAVTLPAISEDLVGVIDTLATKASPAEVLKLLGVLYPDRVEILDSAYSSAEQHQSNVPAGALYQRLTALLTDGLDIIRKSGQIIDCKDVVPGEVAVQESDTVRSSSKLRSLRSFAYKGTKRPFYPHLRINSASRVYFDYIPEEQRMVIAYVGRHLAN